MGMSGPLLYLPMDGLLTKNLFHTVSTNQFILILTCRSIQIAPEILNGIDIYSRHRLMFGYSRFNVAYRKNLLFEHSFRK